MVETPSQLMQEVARRIRGLRLQRDLSARELADRCVAAGAPSLTRSTIAKIESGNRRFITLDEMAALAQALEVSPDVFLQPAAEAGQLSQGSHASAARSPDPLAAPAARALAPGIRPSADPASLSEELHALHRGRGVQAADLEVRLGPHLRELAERQPGSHVDLRTALTAALIPCIDILSPDLRLAALASLALSAQTERIPFFRERVSWLGEQLGREYRTALRRIDAAEQMLAEVIARELSRRSSSATAPYDWYLDELRALLRLDTPHARGIRHRRVIATTDGLSEVRAWLDVPNTSGRHPGLMGEIMYGGRLIRREHPSASRYQFIVQLPSPFRPGRHTSTGSCCAYLQAIACVLIISSALNAGATCST